MRVGVKAAWIGGFFLILATVIAAILAKSKKTDNNSSIQSVHKQDVDTGSINNYNVGGDAKFENNTFNILPQDSFKKVETKNKNSKPISINNAKEGQGKEPKNQIINNAPNQGVQVTENNGTINVNIPINRAFTKDDARSILKDLPKDFPISVDLLGVDKESKSFYNQVLNSFKSLGYTNVVTDNFVHMPIGLGDVPENGFNYFIKDGKFKFVIYKLDR